jgi:hypothetical protein
MPKKEITWLELMKSKFAEFKKMGQTPSVKEVANAAKKEWTTVKAGVHPLYIQGSSAGKKGSKKNKRKSEKKSKRRMMMSSRPTLNISRGGGMSELSPGTYNETGTTSTPNATGSKQQQPTTGGSGSFTQLLSRLKLCKGCTKKIRNSNKKSMKGGCGDTPCGGLGLVGGKKRKSQKKRRGGGDDVAAADVAAADVAAPAADATTADATATTADATATTSAAVNDDD